MTDLLRSTSKFKTFTRSLQIHMVEWSLTLQKFQHKNLKCVNEDIHNGNVDQKGSLAFLNYLAQLMFKSTKKCTSPNFSLIGV
ncbi:unnamed protein product, partial [Vitis vinifera]|uniref:Uncharacterized protein n=1 Tax=Vitis vinifera TaxID=29760 RepID=D7TKI2_VITVI